MYIWGKCSFGHNFNFNKLPQSHFHSCQIQSLFFFCIQGRVLSLQQIGQTWSILMQIRSSLLQPPLVSPISLQLSALNRFPSHWGWISLGPLNGFSRLLNRFLGIGSNFSHSPAEWRWQERVSIFNPGTFQRVTLRHYNLIFLISSWIPFQMQGCPRKW